MKVEVLVSTMFRSLTHRTFSIAVLIGSVLLVSGHMTCKQPSLNTTVFESIRDYGACTLLRKVCADDGMLVTFEAKHVADNLTSASPYGGVRSHTGLWNFPARGGANSDALIGHQPGSFVRIRPASRREASPHLQRPVFSSCTLPVVMVTDWPYNMHEVFAQLASVADVFFRQQGMLDDLATLVLATPVGLGTSSFHQVLLSPYSRYPLITLDDLSERPLHNRRVAWSAEGVHFSCFDRAVLCKLHGFPQPMFQTAQTLLRHIGPKLPMDPEGFGLPPNTAAAAVEGGRGAGGCAVPCPVGSDTVLHVLFEARSGPARNIKNLPQIISACERADQEGFLAGSFTRLSCKILSTDDTPSLYGVQRFYTTVAAIRSSHVLVAVHGAGAANSVFLKADGGGTALLEVRPCGFGTRFCGWPDAYMQSQLRSAGQPIRFFAYNVDDTAQCQPSDYQVLARGSLYAREDMLARDLHLVLQPGPLLAMLQHVGSLLHNASGWQAAQDTGRVHGYAVADGLVLGPLCVRDMTAHLAGGATLIPI